MVRAGRSPRLRAAPDRSQLPPPSRAPGAPVRAGEPRPCLDGAAAAPDAGQGGAGPQSPEAGPGAAPGWSFVPLMRGGRELARPPMRSCWKRPEPAQPRAGPGEGCLGPHGGGVGEGARGSAWGEPGEPSWFSEGLSGGLPAAPAGTRKNNGAGNAELQGDTPPWVLGESWVWPHPRVTVPWHLPGGAPHPVGSAGGLAPCKTLPSNGCAGCMPCKGCR